MIDPFVLLFCCTVRIGIIYIFSAFVGSLAAALFVQNSPAVCASGSLFGLLGAMLSGLIRNWNFYTDKVLPPPLLPHFPPIIYVFIIHINWSSD